MILDDWAKFWGVPDVALSDLRRRVVTAKDIEGLEGASETRTQQEIRLNAQTAGSRLWRNNVGALMDERGIPVRYGLANESKQENKNIKSADLIGITPVLIGPEHVGRILGIFTSVEAKKAGWTYSGNGREPAQLEWANIINGLGGIAYFSTGEFKKWTSQNK